MSTTDGAIDQKLFHDLEWIFYCLLQIIFMQMKHLPTTKLYILFLAKIKHCNRYLKHNQSFEI